MGFLRKLLIAALVVGPVCWALAVGALWHFQDNVLYPGAGVDRPLHSIAPDGGVIYDQHQKAWAWVAHPYVTPKATLVFFHGGGDRAELRWEYHREYFLRRGMRVIFAEYPGYGERTGQIAAYDTLVPDAQALLAKVQQTYVDAPVWVAGDSLGAAIAAQVADTSNIEQVFLITPWHRFDDVFAQNFPWAPARWLVNASYDSCQALSHQKAKVRVLYSGQDTLIPPEHAKSLIRCLGISAAQVLEMPDAGHDDWSVRMTADQWDWLLNNTTRGRTSQ